MGEHKKNGHSWDGMLAGGILLALILVGVIVSLWMFFRALT